MSFWLRSLCARWGRAICSSSPFAAQIEAEIPGISSSPQAGFVWPCPGLKSLHQSLFDAFSCLHREQEAARSTGTVAAGREAQPVWDSHLFSCCSLQKKDEAGVGESRGFPGLQRVPDPDRIPQGGRGGHAGVEMDSALVPVGLGALRGSRRGAAVGLGVDMDPVQGSGPSPVVGGAGPGPGLGVARLCSLSLLELFKHTHSGQ